MCEFDTYAFKNISQMSYRSVRKRYPDPTLPHETATSILYMSANSAGKITEKKIATGHQTLSAQSSKPSQHHESANPLGTSSRETS